MRDEVIQDFLDKKLDDIKKFYNPKSLWIFGSRVLGKAKKESDIDLIIVSDKFKNTKFIYRMGYFLRKIDYPRHIDAICYTPEEFNKKLEEIGIISEAINAGYRVI